MQRPDIESIEQWVNESRYNKISGHRVAELIEYIKYLEQNPLFLIDDNPQTKIYTGPWEREVK